MSSGKKWQPVGGRDFPAKTIGLDCPTAPNTPIENIADYSALSNRNEAKENPGATAIATGADGVFEAVKLPPHDSPIWNDAPLKIQRHFGSGVA